MQRIGKHCNCKNKDCTSPGPNYECCSEDVPNGGKPLYGLWIEKNYCDRKKGLPIGAEKHESYRVPVQNLHSGKIEGYRYIYQNMDDLEDPDSSDDEYDNCSNWKVGFYLLFILMIILIVSSTVVHLKYKSHK